jgi:hypothetical protein
MEEEDQDDCRELQEQAAYVVSQSTSVLAIFSEPQEMWPALELDSFVKCQ